jgi:hypothetical protein
MQKSLLIFNIFCLSVVSFAQSPVALIPYCKGNLWGFSDISGTRKIPALYERVSLFSSDYSRKENKIIYCAIVVKNGNYGVIDENNNFLIQPDFKSIEEEYLGENLKLFIIKDKYNNYGLSGLSQIILQPAYDSISRVESDYFLLTEERKTGHCQCKRRHHCSGGTRPDKTVIGNKNRSGMESCKYKRNKNYQSSPDKKTIR